jgi:preprotein translocase subunit YajC
LVLNLAMLQPVGPKGGGTPTTAAPPTPDSSGAANQAPPAQSTLFLLAPMLLVVVFMLFTSRSQKKKEAEVRAKLRKGDKVVSQSGLIGELIELDERIAKVKIAPGTNVQMLVSAISPFESAPAPGVDSDKKLADLKDAKAAAEKKG